MIQPTIARKKNRLILLFTLDYEIHGNGEGCAGELMVSPTARILDLFDGFGAKLTIMADTVEIMKFREHPEYSDQSPGVYGLIENQLKDAVRRGHDVQLHLHPAYARASYSGGRWVLDMSEYDLARLPYERICGLVGEGKRFLENLLRPVRPAYRCLAFRAANWSMSPSRDIIRALLANGISIDTSVFKYGKRDELVRFDYSKAENAVVPWPADPSEICRRDDAGELFEFPIYCEARPLWAFLSANRFRRLHASWRHRFREQAWPPESKRASWAAGAGAGGSRRLTSLAVRKFSAIFKKHAWKLDFNQCSGRQMMSAVRRAGARHGDAETDLPIVCIGHSKTYNSLNERQLRKFLRTIADHPDEYGFGTFGEFDLESFRRRPAGTAKSVQNPS